MRPGQEAQAYGASHVYSEDDPAVFTANQCLATSLQTFTAALLCAGFGRAGESPRPLPGWFSRSGPALAAAAVIPVWKFLISLNCLPPLSPGATPSLGFCSGGAGGRVTLSDGGPAPAGTVGTGPASPLSPRWEGAAWGSGRTGRPPPRPGAARPLLRNPLCSPSFLPLSCFRPHPAPDLSPGKAAVSLNSVPLPACPHPHVSPPAVIFSYLGFLKFSFLKELTEI